MHLSTALSFFLSTLFLCLCWKDLSCFYLQRNCFLCYCVSYNSFVNYISVSALRIVFLSLLLFLSYFLLKSFFSSYTCSVNFNYPFSYIFFCLSLFPSLSFYLSFFYVSVWPPIRLGKLSANVLFKLLPPPFTPIFLFLSFSLNTVSPCCHKQLSSATLHVFSHRKLSYNSQFLP